MSHNNVNLQLEDGKVSDHDFEEEVSSHIGSSFNPPMIIQLVTGVLNDDISGNNNNDTLDELIASIADKLIVEPAEDVSAADTELTLNKVLHCCQLLPNCTHFERFQEINGSNF